MADYYSILEVPRNASDIDIKNAFKKKAMTHHPDRGGNEDAFKQINEAYDTLKDPQKKSMYDQFGTSDPRQQHQPRGQQYHFHGDINVEDIFDQMFSQRQGSPFFGRGFNQRQNQNITIAADIELEDIITGKSFIATFRLGNGQEQTVNIDIPRGVRPGDTINFRGMGGNEFFPGRQAGDLHVKIRVKKHAIYDVNGLDLYVNKNVDVIDLIQGTSIAVETIHSKKLNVQIPAGSNPGTTFSIHEQGLPDHRSGQTGSLFIKINGVTPDINDKQTQKKLKKLVQ
jgi:curved DNA-binding protein